jgi:hypothetical protein
MSTWKRWSWRNLIGVLFALTMLLQGGGCAINLDGIAYPVPGIQGKVIAKRYVTDTGRHYYLIEIPGPNGTQDYRYAYDDSAAYQIIERYFIGSPNISVNGLDRAGLPGGSGAPPPPAQ